MKVLSKINSTQAQSIRALLNTITTDSEVYINALQQPGCYLFVKGSDSRPDALSICMVSDQLETNDSPILIGLSICLVWVRQEYRGTGLAKDFSQDVGFKLGHMFSEKYEKLTPGGDISLEAFARCNNQGGYNCAHYTAELFSGAFQLYNLNVIEKIKRNFHALFENPIDPVY